MSIENKGYRELLDEVQLTMRNMFEMNQILIDRCRDLEESNHQLRKDVDDLNTALTTANNLIDKLEDDN